MALTVYCISKQMYYVAIIPFAVALIIIATSSLSRLMYVIAFIAPLSLQLSFFIDVENDISLPLEPLLIGLFAVVLFKFLFEPSAFNKQLLRHPISIAIYVNLAWLVITSATSTMPLVSWKFTLSRMWILAAFYIMPLHLFTERENIFRYLWVYAISFISVIIYTLVRLSGFGFFNKNAANFVVSPLLPDHTSYGAILAMLIPLIILTVFIKRFAHRRLLTIGVTSLYLVALLLSYTRAAWVGLSASAVLMVMLMLRIRAKTIVVMSISLLAVVIAFSSQIFDLLEKNRQDSSNNIQEQISSIFNISTDVSNLERINRWKSAIRMFQDCPIFGFGPGTYKFQYAPYQFAYDRTVISTNSGDVGSAHSEYLGSLAESGLLGAVTFIAILAVITVTAFRVYYNSADKEVKLLVMALLLGHISYYVHAFMNNFFDIDKFSLLFWGYAAAIVALDVKLKRNQISELEQEKPTT